MKKVKITKRDAQKIQMAFETTADILAITTEKELIALAENAYNVYQINAEYEFDDEDESYRVGMIELIFDEYIFYTVENGKLTKIEYSKY